MELKFRNLRADEIECRVQAIYDKGLVLLLYKDARCDMNLLDEVVGAMHWQRRHYEVKGNLYCEVSIYNETADEWVGKSDCGIESNTEKQKGEASDSFKRACTNWGIGRELYTAPFIWIPLTGFKAENKNGKTFTKDRFSVAEIEYSGKTIISLVVRNDSMKKTVFTYPLKETQPTVVEADKRKQPQRPQSKTDGSTEWLYDEALKIGIFKDIVNAVAKKKYDKAVQELGEAEILELFNYLAMHTKEVIAWYDRNYIKGGKS